MYLLCSRIQECSTDKSFLYATWSAKCQNMNEATVGYQRLAQKAACENKNKWRRWMRIGAILPHTAPRQCSTADYM